MLCMSLYLQMFYPSWDSIYPEDAIIKLILQNRSPKFINRRFVRLRIFPLLVLNIYVHLWAQMVFLYNRGLEILRRVAKDSLKIHKCLLGK